MLVLNSLPFLVFRFTKRICFAIRNYAFAFIFILLMPTLLMLILFLPTVGQAEEATRLKPSHVQPQILNSPISVPEFLLKKMSATKMTVAADGLARLRYVAKQDAEMLRNWLRAEGYLDAKLNVSIEQDQPVWRIESGELWKVGRVNISPPVPDEKLLLLKPGDVFRSEVYEQRKTALNYAWSDAGYLQASFASASATPNDVTHTVDIDWQVATGALFYIGDIKVEGAKQYTPALALRLSRLKAGQLVSQIRLQSAMQYIIADPRYQTAMIMPLNEDKAEQQADNPVNKPSTNRIPLRIVLTEASWKKLTADAGYATDTGFLLGANWTDRSLNEGQLEYSLRGEVTQVSSGVGATLLRPTWPNDDQKVGINIDYNRVHDAGREYTILAVAPFWQQDFEEQNYLRLSLRSENVQESNASVVSLGPRVDIHFADEVGGLIPLSGWRIDTSFALPVRVNSTGMWGVLNVVGRVFYQPNDWVLLTPRVGFGQTLNIQGDAPKTYRQFAGGATSARGYALDTLGASESNGLAVGGLMKTFMGLDILLSPNAETFSTVFFADAARVWDTGATDIPTVTSAGIGEVIRTPAGPLRLDLAFPLQRRAQDAAYQFYLTLGDMF